MVHLEKTPGSCQCGAVTFEVGGTDTIFNAFCHCKVCSRAYGVSPVHLIGVPNEGFHFTNGSEENTKMYEGKIMFCLCKTCGVKVYQHPKNASFKAVLPTNFNIEQGEVACALPDSMKPSCHVNYENRLLDCADDLPKWKVFPNSSVVLNNDGTVKEG